MDVGSTAGVVTGESGLEVNNTVGVTFLDTTEESGVDVQRVGGVTVTAGDNSRVDTLCKSVICFLVDTIGFSQGIAYSGVAVPQISVDLGNRLAGVGVDELDVHEEGNTLLILGNVLTNKLTSDV